MSLGSTGDDGQTHREQVTSAENLENHYLRYFKPIVIVLIILLFSIGAIGFGAAQEGNSTSEDHSSTQSGSDLWVECGGEAPTAIAQLVELLNWVQKIAIVLGLMFAVIQIIRAGIYLQIGNQQAVREARRILIQTGGGIVLITLATSLVRFMTEILCGGAA